MAQKPQANGEPHMEQIDLTKLSVQQLQQLKTEFEQVCICYIVLLKCVGVAVSYPMCVVFHLNLCP